jgi:hypothetical protein
MWSIFLKPQQSDPARSIGVDGWGVMCLIVWCWSLSWCGLFSFRAGVDIRCYIVIIYYTLHIILYLIHIIYYTYLYYTLLYLIYYTILSSSSFPSSVLFFQSSSPILTQPSIFSPSFQYSHLPLSSSSVLPIPPISVFSPHPSFLFHPSHSFYL